MLHYRESSQDRGDTRVSIPSHRQVNKRTAEGIGKDLEEELGARWWRWTKATAASGGETADIG